MYGNNLIHFPVDILSLFSTSIVLYDKTDLFLILLIFVLHVMQFLTTHFSEFQLASVATFLLHESVFFLSGIPFMVLERAGLLSKYKIQVC